MNSFDMSYFRDFKAVFFIQRIFCCSIARKRILCRKLRRKAKASAVLTKHKISSLENTKEKTSDENAIQIQRILRGYLGRMLAKRIRMKAIEDAAHYWQQYIDAYQDLQKQRELRNKLRFNVSSSMINAFTTI